jgi:acyl-CoA thioesterase
MFARASAVARVRDGVYAADLGAGWTQGPGIYGGLSGAVVLRAMAHEAQGRPVRSLSLQYCAPLPPGPCRIEVTPERAGTGASFLSARVQADDRLQVHAIGAFGTDRPADLDEDHVRPPSVPPPEDVPGFPPDLPGIPTFIRNWDLRFAYGAPPYSGAASSRVGAWIRPREPEPLDAALALALLDVLPPAILARETRPRPVTTMALHAHFLDAFPRADLPPDAFYWLDVHSLVTRAGHSDEEVRLFDRDGRLLALARQLFVVVR